jgi:hypothetical protein
MTYAWIPPQCYYPALSSQYTPFTDRRWYLACSQNESLRVSPAELAAGKYREVWAANYHKSHCLFLWRKLAWAVEGRERWIDARAGDRVHSDHCAEILDELPEDPGALSRVKLSFFWDVWSCRGGRW